MRKTFSASLDQLYAMLAFIRERSIAAGLDPLIIARVELACEEALVNIISYAYPNSSGSIDIFCRSADQPGIKISLRDQGIAYDPLNNQMVRKEDQLGGYGILLIRKIMDEVQYKREASDNVLTLVKYAKGFR
jgi:serine/threonine-protein kinase RsbW